MGRQRRLDAWLNSDVEVGGNGGVLIVMRKEAPTKRKRLGKDSPILDCIGDEGGRCRRTGKKCDYCGIT